MTRKHYKIAAEAISQARKKINMQIDDDESRKRALEAITELECNLMTMFISDNERFSVVKFLAATK
jgi:16S rRNA U1498 N3-methylase RsmE